METTIVKFETESTARTATQNGKVIVRNVEFHSLCDIICFPSLVSATFGICLTGK